MSLESIIDSYGYFAGFLGSVLEGKKILVLAGYAAQGLKPLACSDWRASPSRRSRE